LREDPRKGYPGRTYRFYKGPIIYPFGHGLSYTTFSHALAHAPTAVTIPFESLRAFENSTVSSNAVRITSTNCGALTFGVHIDVKNTGNMDGTHTLLVFSSPPIGKWGSSKQLVGFEKVHILAGAQQGVKVDIHVCKHLSVVDQFGIRRIPMGEHTIHIGEDLKHSFSLSKQL